MPVNVFNTFDDPLASTGTTQAFGVNDADKIVGSYLDANSKSHGFLYSGGTFITLNDPFATFGTFAFGINATDQIVGYYQNGTGTHGFLESGGIYTTLDDPSASSSTQARVINDTHHTGGLFVDISNHGFLDTTGTNPTPPAGTAAA